MNKEKYINVIVSKLQDTENKSFTFNDNTTLNLWVSGEVVEHKLETIYLNEHNEVVIATSADVWGTMIDLLEEFSIEEIKDITDIFISQF